MWKSVLALVIVASSAQADAADQVIDAARASFDQMPSLERVDQIRGNCGADDAVNPYVAYCTSSNAVLLRADTPSTQAAYFVAHSLGHAVQVKHGVADIALKEITRRRAEEPKLRGYVEGQVDCIAGFLMARAGLAAPSVNTMFTTSPLQDVHWGRNPLTVGPVVQISMAQRTQWVTRGFEAATLAQCAVGEFGAELLLRAYKG